MNVAKRAVKTNGTGPKASTGKSTSTLRLRLLIHDLITELHTLDEQSLSFSDTSRFDNGNFLNFYDEVERFETALIRRALRHTGGHQLNAACVLSLNPSTLNAKIKQYQIRYLATQLETNNKESNPPSNNRKEKIK